MAKKKKKRKQGFFDKIPNKENTLLAFGFIFLMFYGLSRFLTNSSTERRQEYLPPSFVVDTPTPEPFPTSKPYPTSRPYPTFKPLPTWKPLPTSTPFPTYTPLPTWKSIQVPVFELPQDTQQNSYDEEQNKIDYEACVADAESQAYQSCAVRNTCDSFGYGSPSWEISQETTKCAQLYGYY